MTILPAPVAPRRRISGACRWFAIAEACVALAGCAPAPVAPDAVTAAPEPGRALIIGWGNTVGENAREALTAKYGSRIARLFVARVNAEKVSFGDNIARVPPGEHDLTILCGVYINHFDYSYELVVRASLNANRVYRLRSELNGRRCEPTLEDVTGKGE